MGLRFLFGRAEVLPVERLLRLDGGEVPLGARGFDVLLALLQHRDRLLSRAELLEYAWPGLVVEENNLSVQVAGLRKLLGPECISTVAGRGYRFSMPVVEANDARPSPASSPTPIALAATTATLDDETCFIAAIACAGLGSSWWQAAVASLVPAHGGTVLPGFVPGLLARFPTPRSAAACALKLQASVQAAANGGPSGNALRIGLCLGLDAAAASTGMDKALLAAVAGAAAPGEIILTESVAGHLISGLDGDLEDLGRPDGQHRHFRLASPQEANGRWVLVSDMRPTLAVLPFSDSESSSTAFGIGDVLADQLIELLSRSELFNVTSRLSTGAFRHRGTGLDEMARHLHAGLFVSGHCRHVSGRIHVHAELADARTGLALWTTTLSDSEHAALQVDSDLVQSLATGLTRAIFSAELRSAHGKPLPGLASHTLLLSAVGLMYRLSPADFMRAKEALDELRRRAPHHAAPAAWLARWHLFRVVQGWSTSREEDGELARRHASDALEADPESALALTMLGNVHTNYLRDLEGAEALYDRALALNPNGSLTWLQKGNAQSFRGDGAHALSCVEKAIGLSPIDPANHFYLTILAGAALSAGEYERAITAARSALRLNRTHVSTHRTLAIALSLAGRLPEAREAVTQVLQHEPGLTVRGFVARSPGAASGLAEKFGLALQAAGLP